MRSAAVALRSILIALCLLMLTTACGGGQTRTQWDGPPQSEAEAAYRDALEEKESGQLLEATKRLNRVRLKYPYSSRWTTLAELRLADILFEQNRYGQAASMYQQFVKSHPTHEEVHYSLFRIGECHYEKIPTDFFIFPDPWQRELRHVRFAEEAYQRFLIKYPESEHAVVAREHLTHARTYLANHELYVAEYYLKSDHFLGSVNRLLILAERYSDLPTIEQGLFLMAHNYILLNDVQAAAAALQRLVSDFPEAELSPDARAWLEKNNLRDVKPMPIGVDLLRQRQARARSQR